MMRVAWIGLAVLFQISSAACCQEGSKRAGPDSEWGVEFYSQGGVVVDGIAYFTSDDGDYVKTGLRSPSFPGVVAFDVRTLRKVRTYPISRTYDSSPFLVQRKDGTWLVIAHEYKNKRTVACHRDAGRIEWISEANQPGSYFFGYSSFRRPDGTQLILLACQNGLHAMSGETGKDVWWVKEQSTGGITPCVDQKEGWIFYQCDGKVLKVRATDGEILKMAPVKWPNVCISWNTVLVNDSDGYLVATRWYGKPEWDSALRVYDKDLNLIWERTGLPVGKKDTLTYAEGKLVTGSGNHWSKRYEGDKWKYVAAYSIRDGSILWRCDLSHIPYESIFNLPYFNGFFYAETTGGDRGPSKLLRIRASDGKLMEVLDYGRSISSCAPCIIAHGKVFSGDLGEDRIVVTQIAENSKADWPGPFGDPNRNQFALPEEPAAKLVPMREIRPQRASADERISFEQSASQIDAYDFVELAVKVSGPRARNPFQDVAVTGQFQEREGPPSKVEGFGDSPDGSLHRIRFMPTKPGQYSYAVEYRQGDQRQTHSGKFTARDGKRRGLVRIDRDHPWHFVWEGTGEHYFWNGTTTYWLLGWQDEDIIQKAIDRLARLKVNRLRVALCGRTRSGDRWFEPLVVNTDKFQFRLNPWVAQRPDSVEKPGFDVTRYNVAFWQKCDRMLRHARDKGMIISIIFYLDGKDPGVDPFGKSRMGSEDEQRYYRYGAARLAAFSNVMWDVANEYRFFRDDSWAEKMGTFIKTCDPYQHLTSTHGHGDFRFRTSPWADFAMYQSWDEAGGHDFMLKNRQQQAATGRPMPQINEEYGYEDHYPARWGGGRKAPARSGDNRRRLAWGMYMAGGYQTTGERADRGTGRGPDAGGGWINGRGDDTMTMLEGYGHIVTCFTSLQWWKLEPRDDLVSRGVFCLAEPGRQYLLYLPGGGKADVKLGDGKYQARWYNPRNGQWAAIGGASGPKWTSPRSPDDGDWAIVLRREE